MTEAVKTYRALDPAKVVETIAVLEHRITERFPGAGLGGVCAELLRIARENSVRVEAIARRNLPLRLGVFALLAVGVWLLIRIAFIIDYSRTSADNVFTMLQGIESALNIVVLMGVTVIFLVTVEERLKRRRALGALHELRSVVHVIDMHQLTKDPSSAVTIAGRTASSPERRLSHAELSRYLDYCSEMLSLAAKVAVLYAQSLPDPVVTEAVSDIERITANLSQKVWQKIAILETMSLGGGAGSAARSASAPVPSAPLRA